MKNNKGLTLVELLGVMIVLSLIVMIVTTTVTKDLKDSSVELCYHQLDSLVSASKNWLTDQINEDYSIIYINGKFETQKVTGEQLLNQGYVSELEQKYKGVIIEITKNGDNYSYEILPSKSDFCN